MFLEYYSEHLFVAQYVNFNRFHFLLASNIRNVSTPGFVFTYVFWGMSYPERVFLALSIHDFSFA